MSEQEIMKKCVAAFPELEKSTSEASESMLDLFAKRNPETIQKQLLLAKELGFPESGSILIDTSHAKRECIVKSALENEKRNLIDTAEDKLATAVLKGENRAFVMPLGKGKSLVSDILFEAPKLTDHQQAIMDGISKKPGLEAAVVQDPNDKSKFYIAVQERQKK